MIMNIAPSKIKTIEKSFVTRYRLDSGTLGGPHSFSHSTVRIAVAWNTDTESTLASVELSTSIS